MPNYYNNHVVAGSLTVGAGNVTESTPARIELTGMAAGLHRVHLYADLATTDVINVRLTDGQQQITPVGGWLVLPVGGVLSLDVDRVLPGPPWSVFVEAWGTAGVVRVALEMADIRETDTDLQILHVLQAIYNEFFRRSKV